MKLRISFMVPSRQTEIVSRQQCTGKCLGILTYEERCQLHRFRFLDGHERVNEKFVRIIESDKTNDQ
jgi:hypothetical protein